MMNINLEFFSENWTISFEKFTILAFIYAIIKFFTTCSTRSISAYKNKQTTAKTEYPKLGIFFMEILLSFFGGVKKYVLTPPEQPITIYYTLLFQLLDH